MLYRVIEEKENQYGFMFEDKGQRCLMHLLHQDNTYCLIDHPNMTSWMLSAVENHLRKFGITSLKVMNPQASFFLYQQADYVYKAEHLIEKQFFTSPKHS